MPIDVLGPVNPVIMDLLRYGLAVVLIVGVRRSGDGHRGLGVLIGVLLCLYNVALLLRGLYADQGSVMSQATIGIVSVLVAILATRNWRINRAILAGFLAGATLSATDILLQVAGLPYLGTPTEWGTRYPGLSFTSTNTAPFLALALVLVISSHLWTSRPAVRMSRILLFVILFAGLALSGGRGGLGGFILALTVFLMFRFSRQPILAVITSAAGLVVVVTRWDQLMDFLTRGGTSSGFTTGRDELNAQAWSAFLDSPILGVELVSRAGYNPHTPILSFALDIGLAGLLVGIAGVFALLLRMARPIRRGPAGEVLCMMAAVMVVTALLEPVGFFVGFTKACLLMIVLTGGVRDYEKSEEEPATTPSGDQGLRAHGRPAHGQPLSGAVHSGHAATGYSAGIAVR
ncbi:hypothetical protein M3D92_08565 [Micrococcus terreus]|uniref:O-antigen ligase family protein n=1 Tax=Micrococcus terreus TaxID=574650 RepID=UPI0021A631A3|nr:hypothetical protein [Micrococcus terreus]MCT2089342.1 hypothetical protein [Micrococcus terreus]